VVFVIVLGIVAAGGVLVYTLFFGDSHPEAEQAPEPNMTEMSFFDHPLNSNLVAGRMYAVINGEVITAHTAPTMIDGSLHLPADLLRAYVDRYIFWEENTSRLTITNASQVMRFYPMQTTYTINWQEQPLAHPIREIAGMAYMSADMAMERYPVTITHNADYNFIILDFSRYEQWVHTVIEITDENEDIEDPFDEESFIPLRFGNNNQYPIMARLHAGDRIVSFSAIPSLIFDEDGDIIETFHRVQAENGLVGYISTANLSSRQHIAAVPDAIERRPVTRAEEPVNFAWQMSNLNNPDAWVAPQGMNAISPTWFTFTTDMSGDIFSRARHDYVAWAHSQGMAVWPMIQDADPDMAFSSAISRAVLEDAYVRDHVINQLMGFIADFNLDGIQVDYEVVPEDMADHWIQFLRELSVPMRESGSVLSVAAKVPMPHNMFWNRTEIGLTVDYIIIMAYDEHWATIPTAGSVASFDFVADGVRGTINEVFSHQIILGLPTYARVWEEHMVDGQWQLLDNNVGGVAQRSFGMAGARNAIESRGGVFEWDYVTRQYYGEVEVIENGVEVRYRVWLADLRSTNEKLELVRRYNLAGVGFWQLGLELPGMWAEVYRHLND